MASRAVLRRILAAAATAPLVFAGGCDPVVNIAGANFPAWLLCAIAGIVLAAMFRPLFVLTRIEQYLWPTPLVYSSLAVLLGCIVYLIFFNRI
jgi:YtcA family